MNALSCPKLRAVKRTPMLVDGMITEPLEEFDSALVDSLEQQDTDLVFWEGELRIRLH